MTGNAFIFERHGRSKGTAFVLLIVYAAFAWLWLVLSVAPVIMALCILVTVPALFDLLINPKSGLRLDQENLSWHHGRRNVSIPRHNIQRIHISLRMDRSIKLTVELESGKKIRVTQPSIPPLAILEEALGQQNLPYQKHPFALL